MQNIFQNIDAVRSTAPLAVTFASALLEEQREQNRKVRSCEVRWMLDFILWAINVCMENISPGQCWWHTIYHISGVQHFHKFFPLRTTLQWWIKQRRKGKMRRTLLQDEGMRFFTHVEFTNYKFMIYFVLSSGWRQNHP